MALLIPPDAPPRELLPANPPLFTIEELWAAVGGYIEIVGRLADCWVVCNERGKLEGLPVNPVATELLRRAGLLLEPLDYLVGSVLLCENSELD